MPNSLVLIQVFILSWVLMYEATDNTLYRDVIIYYIIDNLLYTQVVYTDLWGLRVFKGGWYQGYCSMLYGTRCTRETVICYVDRRIDHSDGY